MLLVLLTLEIAITMVAASIVAWLRYPERRTDDYHIGCLRYIAPPMAFLMFLLTIVIFLAWLGDKSAATPPSAIAVIFFAAMMVFYIIWAIREIRRPRVAHPPRVSHRTDDPRVVSAHRPRRASVMRRSNRHH